MSSPWAAGADDTAAHHQRDRLHHKAFVTCDSTIWQQYRALHNRINKLLSTAMCAYLSQTASLAQGRASKFCSYFCHLSCRKA